MKLAASEANIPRIHLLATLAVVLVMTMSLIAFFTWQNHVEQVQTLQRVEQTIQAEKSTRLSTELDAVTNYLQFMHSRTEETLRRNAAAQVDSVMQLVEALYARESPRRSPEEVKRLIIEAIRPMRFFDGRGYFFIDDMKGQFILLPTGPHYEGKDGIDNRDDTGHYIMRGLIDAARRPDGQGFSRYRWYRPDSPKVMADKIAYVRYFKPFDWLIGTGDYTYEWEEMQKQEAIARLRRIRIGDSGYVGILNLQGKSILSPGLPSVEGKFIPAMPSRYHEALNKLMETARSGGGLVNYVWPHPKTGALAKKTALVRTFEPWGWVLVANIYLDETEAAIAKEMGVRREANLQRTSLLALVVALTLALGVLTSFTFTRWARQLFQRYDQERKRTEMDLRISAIAFEAQEGMFVTDDQSVILRVNRSFTDITGYTPEDVIGKTPAILSSGRHDARFFESIWKQIAEHDAWRGEIWNRRKDGTVYPEWLTITAVRNALGTVTHYVSTLTDITLRKAAEEQIRHLAFFDPLTRLPNRRMLLDRLNQAMVNSRRTAQTGALLFIDLDHFKMVNDTLGHDKGDGLLEQVAHRLTESVREGDTVARQGGDEFVVMLENLGPDRTEAATRADLIGQKILQRVSRPYHVAGHEIVSSCSVGVALFQGQTDTPEELMKRADTAMYQAKEAGRHTVRFFDPEMHGAMLKRVAMEAAMRDSLRDGRFVLFYQGQTDSQGRLRGTEALLRWQHPTLGLIPPAQFIPIAEDTGLILPLGRWVLQTACEQLTRWAQQPDWQHVSVSVNVSGRQMRQANFVQEVLEVLAQTGAPPERLKLEITESLLLVNKEDTIAKMDALKARGVGFSLDDFGTGYSSLAYLKRLPLDQLKIDRSFVRELPGESRDAAIVQSIVALASSLGLTTIAEGVETGLQKAHLERLGCHNFQGFLFGLPAPVEQLSLNPVQADWPAGTDDAPAPSSRPPR